MYKREDFSDIRTLLTHHLICVQSQRGRSHWQRVAWKDSVRFRSRVSRDCPSQTRKRRRWHGASASFQDSAASFSMRLPTNGAKRQKVRQHVCSTEIPDEELWNHKRTKDLSLRHTCRRTCLKNAGRRFLNLSKRCCQWRWRVPACFMRMHFTTHHSDCQSRTLRGAARERSDGFWWSGQGRCVERVWGVGAWVLTFWCITHFWHCRIIQSKWYKVIPAAVYLTLRNYID